jgi:hypothetical protein
MEIRDLNFCAFFEMRQIRGPFEKFVDWRQCAAVVHREAINVRPSCTGVYPKVSGLSHNKINNNNNNKHSLRSNTKGYGGKTH